MAAARFFGQDDRDDLETLFDAIESDHRAIEHPERVDWTIERLRVVLAECGFEPPRGVVADVADGAACEWHETGTAREFALAEVVADPLGGVAGKRLGFAVALDERLEAFAADDHFGFGAEEGVACDALAAFD